MFYHKHIIFFIEIISIHLVVDLYLKTQIRVFILISISIAANYKMYGLFHTKWLTWLRKILYISRIVMALLALCLCTMKCFIPVYIFQIHTFKHGVLLLVLCTNVVSLRYTFVDNRKKSDLSKKSTVFFSSIKKQKSSIRICKHIITFYFILLLLLLFFFGGGGGVKKNSFKVNKDWIWHCFHCTFHTIILFK